MSRKSVARKKKRRSRGAQDFVLQITSLADIFTILLVFLIKAFSSGTSSLSPSQDIILPISETTDKITENFKMELGKSALIFEDRVVLALQNFEFDPRDIEANGTPRALNQVLARLRSQATPDKPLSQRILVLADQDAPYKTLKRIFAAATNNGFDDYRLVVAEDK
jgi:biopolymer transport protein ExbD